ncbi:endoplasmic reticulum resident protein 27 isoform 2-T2 [Guaruba guarouba]
MARTGQAGTMGTSVFLCLLIILLTRGSPAVCAGDNSSASHSTASTAEKPVLLHNVADAEAFISGAEVAVIGFFQEPNCSEAAQFRLTAGRIPEVPFGLSTSRAVLSHYGVEANTLTLFRMVDNQRKDLDMNNNDIDAEKMTRFIRINELRLVTEYTPSILFILVDINLKSNERTVSFFKLKKSQLPALAIFNGPDEEQDVLTLDEVSVERVQDFCNGFIERMEKGEDEPEEKTLNEEL